MLENIIKFAKWSIANRILESKYGKLHVVKFVGKN